MKKPWHLTNPDLLRRAQEEVRAAYPDLTFSVEDRIVYLRGSFPVLHQGAVLDRYQIEIELPIDWPESVGIIRETAGRIPHLRERHVNPEDGTCCPIVPEEWLVNQERESLVAFLKGPIHNYFLSQSLVEEGEPWPFGEREHGRDGAYQSYEELIGTHDRIAVLRHLECLSKDTMRGHLDCPCGSGKRIRDCCRERLNLLREKIGSKIAAKALHQLRTGIRALL